MRQHDLDTSVYPFQFTRNWFRNRNLPTFREYVMPFWKDKPCTYLELGVFEGMSMVWMLQKVLTHPSSKGVGVDPWLMTTKLSSEIMDEVRARAYCNTSWYSQCKLIRGSSAEVLRIMNGKAGYKGIGPNSVNIAMIDGDHNDLAVLDDARNCFGLVRPGGWLLFDDVENDHEKARHVKQGLAMFLSETGDRLKQIWKHGYVEAFERVS